MLKTGIVLVSATWQCVKEIVCIPSSSLVLPSSSQSPGKEDLVHGPHQQCAVRKSPCCLVVLAQGARPARAGPAGAGLQLCAWGQ